MKIPEKTEAPAAANFYEVPKMEEPKQVIEEAPPQIDFFGQNQEINIDDELANLEKG